MLCLAGLEGDRGVLWVTTRRGRGCIGSYAEEVVEEFVLLCIGMRPIDGRS